MRKVILIILVLVFMLLILCGCSSNSNATNDENNRFVKISDTEIDFINDAVVFYDKETRIQYLFIDGDRSGGLTVLLNRDGTPLLY